MKHLSIKNRVLVILLALFCLSAGQPAMARRKKKSKTETVAKPGREEFRGVWIQTAWQERYQRMSPAQCQTYLKNLVARMHEIGFNAIIFQVRPEGDAFYRSDYEPWSRFLTGVQGKAPAQVWDPMEYLIGLCHQYGMEFHAWINPYRMTMSKAMTLDKQHLYYQHPEWFVRYDERLYLNPGLPESRSYIRTIVKDIVSRYEIDALHMDDYFYPYPVGGQVFDDYDAFRTYAPAMGLPLTGADALGNFRRRSVDILIKSVRSDIREIKPWVRFGISPFGIYRNQRSWAGGSQTNGTQCYDDLYADVLFWAQSGWIDYVVPQIYWEIGHQAADYSTLVRWWNNNLPASCQLYVGQSVERSLDAPANSNPDLRESHTNFTKKITQAREAGNVRGNCFWYAYLIDENQFHVADLLRENVFAEPALLPAFTAIDADAPEKVKGIKGRLAQRGGEHGIHLTWEAVADKDPMQEAKYYNVYKFAKGEKVSIKDASHLLLQTNVPQFYDYDVEPNEKYTYLIAPVDICNNEGKTAKKSYKIKLKK